MVPAVRRYLVPDIGRLVALLAGEGRGIGALEVDTQGFVEKARFCVASCIVLGVGLSLGTDEEALGTERAV